VYLREENVVIPSYSGGRDEDDLGSKLAQADSCRDPILKIPRTKKSGRLKWYSDCLASMRP
jgi:hypothetical protein